MATAGGARALGNPDIGHLWPGARADIVRIDLEHPSLQPFDPDLLLAMIVFAGSSRCVTDVWVNGRATVVACEIVNVDIKQVMTNAYEMTQML